MANFEDRYISWEGGHALKRCTDRQKSPSEVEQVIRTSPDLTERADGRWDILGCVDGELTKIIVEPVRKDALKVVTVFGKGAPCS